MTLTAGEWLALGVALGTMATAVSLLWVAAMEARHDRRRARNRARKPGNDWE